MPAVTEKDRAAPGTDVLPFSQAEYSSLAASGKVGQGDAEKACWKVVVRPAGHMIIRDVWYDGKPWDHDAEGWEPEGVIWPTWPARSEDEAALAASPLADVQKDWSTVTSPGSSPLAGSSRMSTSGLAISAWASMSLWRMPME